MDLTAEQEAIAQRTAALVAAKIGRYEPLPESVTPETAMKMLCCESLSALYRELSDLNVRPYRPGKYRRDDIVHAVALRSQSVKQAARRAEAGNVHKGRIPKGLSTWGG